jgi:hypothetical protein
MIASNSVTPEVAAEHELKRLKLCDSVYYNHRNLYQEIDYVTLFITVIVTYSLSMVLTLF